MNLSEANLSDYLPSQTIGVHWSAPAGISGLESRVEKPSVANIGDTLALTWSQTTAHGSDVFFSVSETTDGGLWLEWSDPKKFSSTPESDSIDPQIVMDSQGKIHLVWAETFGGQLGNLQIFYRQCEERTGEWGCDDAVPLSDPAVLACDAEQIQTAPALALNSNDQLMTVWGNLAYSSWKAGENPPPSPSGCLLKDSPEIFSAQSPRLSVRGDGRFVIIFEGNQGQIYTGMVDSQHGIVDLLEVDQGQYPEVYVDGGDKVHMAWCGPKGQLHYQGTDGSTMVTSFPGCLNRPALGMDSNGILHMLWYAQQVEQPSGRITENHLIYESLLESGVWSNPHIVAQSGGMAQPVLTTQMDGQLDMAWVGLEQLQAAFYQPYHCSENELLDISQVAFDVAQSGQFRPQDELVPFCQNRYDHLLILPKADPAYSDEPGSLNGGFDDVAELIQTAQYEVLFSTMWYNVDEKGGQSPGYILAEGVTALYEKVKANPSNYPKGITVRILLDNPPELTASRLISQIWNVFNDMRRAGLPTMEDPEIGWKLEVANYEGSYPHGHTKMVVIDGKTAVSAGFNYQHKHLAVDHPSGLGEGQYDLALQMTGPVAQATQLSFDDLWYGANQIGCPDLGSDSPLWWISCRRGFATTEHVPEVMKYFPVGGEANAFAMHRTVKYEESDHILTKAIESADESLDVLQVNFTLKVICDLNVFFDICDFSDALGYMDAMLYAIETHHTKTRVLIKEGPFEGMESQIAVDAFRDELESRGLDHLVEFRYFEGSSHAKSVLIDDQFLIIGSQNFHYSAYGSGAGLTEFNIGTDSTQAVTDFSRFFDYHWANANPVPDER